MLSAAATVAEHLERAAQPGPVPVASGASPVDAAAAAVATTVRTKVTAMSAQLAGKGPQIQATAQQAVQALDAQDSDNAAQIGAVKPDPTEERKPTIRPVDNQTGPDDPAPPPNDPHITGPAAPPQHEQDQYDLQDQFQDGQGPVFGGDPRAGVPRSPASELAQGPPGTRPLPTGTALGPGNHRYGFFSNAPNTPPADNTINPFVSNGSVWDYTDPLHPVKVGDLPGIFQASGAYDPATNQMVIIGNTSDRIGDTARGLWVSDPIDPAHPNNWINTLHRIPGDVGLAGDRESQLVALKGGGYMFVGATKDGPVSAITAATPQGLIGATPQTLIDQGQLPTVYGPTVMGTSLDPASGLETIQLRVSTWPPNPADPDFYDPHTWTTTFGVQH